MEIFLSNKRTRRKGKGWFEYKDITKGEELKLNRKLQKDKGKLIDENRELKTQIEKMTVFMIETRYKEFNKIVITASYERAQNELSTAEERGVDVIVTPYEIEDL